jgi:hypothetical protein
MELIIWSQPDDAGAETWAGCSPPSPLIFLFHLSLTLSPRLGRTWNEDEPDERLREREKKKEARLALLHPIPVRTALSYNARR